MRTLYHTYLGDTRLQNSPYFCVFKYARGFKQKVWNEPVGRVRLARLERVRLLRHALLIPLLILRKKTDCFAVYGDTATYNIKQSIGLLSAQK